MPASHETDPHADGIVTGEAHRRHVLMARSESALVHPLGLVASIGTSRDRVPVITSTTSCKSRVISELGPFFDSDPDLLQEARRASRPQDHAGRRARRRQSRPSDDPSARSCCGGPTSTTCPTSAMITVLGEHDPTDAGAPRPTPTRRARRIGTAEQHACEIEVPPTTTLDQLVPDKAQTKEPTKRPRGRGNPPAPRGHRAREGAP